MRLQVLNTSEAEKYVGKIVGEAAGHEYLAQVDAHGETPEDAYEAVNHSTHLEIEGLSEIGQDFDEHVFGLEVRKTDYADELAEVTEAHELLEDHGLEYETGITAEHHAKTPREAISSLESVAIHPVLNEVTDEYRATVMHTPGKTPVFEPSVQPTAATTTTAASRHEEELREILRELNIE